MSKVLIQPADTFLKDYEEIKGDTSISREDRDAILEALVKAIKLFSQWDSNMDALKDGYGNGYYYRFHPHYIITFQREKKANQVTLRLHTIQRW